jgi:hypothetical protein
MSLKFIPAQPADHPKDQPYDGSTMFPDLSRGEIVFESSERDGSGFLPAIEELGTKETKDTALAFASRCGMPSPCLNGMSHPIYPVNAKGVPLDMIKGINDQPLPPRHPDMQPAAYRIRIPVCRRLA